jgi:argininosuccinate lyase
LLPALEEFSSSLDLDVQLGVYDVAGSIAHARALRAAGLLDDKQLRAADEGLRQIAAEMAEETFEFQDSDEDIHTAVERRLTELHPEAGSRLHAGRSRNDQVALDLRLFCRDACGGLAQALARLVRVIAAQARRHADVGMPGYTHLQRAQPVTVGHHLLAHAQSLLRDFDRVRHAYESADVMPLGSGALAGTTLTIPREVVAQELGFKTLTANSMDAVADRDFALDLIFACVGIGVHLSRLAEEIVLWASSEFGFLRLPDRVATGSSLMPQKKNPDIAELLRGRSGRALGSFTALATVLKSLVENAFECLEAAALLVHELDFDQARLSSALSDPALLATDSAERLVSEGVAFREAHRRVADSVRRGSHNPPWDAARSLELRRLDVVGQAREVVKRANALSRWAGSHPPPL